MIIPEEISPEELAPAIRVDEAVPATSVVAPGKRLWSNRDFNIFWSGQTLSVLGDAFGILAMPLLVLQATGSVAQMGLVTGTFGVGQLVSGVFAGAIVDRLNRRRLMIFCDFGRLLLYSAIPLVWLTVGPQMWLIYVVAALGALLGNTFQIGSITAVANLVDKDQLTDANGRLQATYSISFLVGPLLAGIVSGAFGPATAIGIDAVSFLASALSLMLVRFRIMQRPALAEGEHESTMQELLAGVKFLWRQPVLRWLTILLFIMGFLAFAGLDLFIFHLKHNLGQNDSAVGVVFGLASVGGLVGSLVASRLRKRWGYGLCWLGGCLVQGISLAIMGIVPTLVSIAGLAILMQAAGSVYGIMSMSFRQETTPDHLLGRVTAAFWTLATISGPLGAAAMTALAEHTSVPFTILLMGLGGIACAAIGVFTPIRTQMVGEKAP